MSTLRSETLYKSTTKRIALSVWREKTRLAMHLQEFDIDPTDPTWQSFTVFKSWSVMVCLTPCKRATEAAVTRFYDANIGRARALVAARITRLLLIEAGEVQA
jgi:hypothetical protein